MLIGIHGKKGSGKSTTARTIANLHEEADDGVFVDVESFAGPIKYIATDILGVDPEVVYGDDAKKNRTFTRFAWEDMPFYGNMIIAKATEKYADKPFKDAVELAKAELPRGLMTVRQLLQCIGTEMFRSFCPKVWVDHMTALVEEHSGDNGYIVDDVRFENEIDCIKDNGGRVYALLRKSDDQIDSHESEKSLDLSLFDAVVDNRNMTLEETAEFILNDYLAHAS